MRTGRLAWVGLAAMLAACGPMGGSDEARQDDEDREERSADRGDDEERASRDDSESKDGGGMAMVEAPAEAPITGEWVMDGTIVGRVEAGIYEISDYSTMIYEDGVIDFSGRIEATDGTDSASFRVEGVGNWVRNGDRVRIDLNQVSVTPEQSGSEYREAARILEAAIRSQPSQSGDIIELDGSVLRIRNIVSGQVESYRRA